MLCKYCILYNELDETNPLYNYLLLLLFFYFFRITIQY
jgi:hypothetical protein